MEEDYTPQTQARVEAMIATGLYQIRVNAIKAKIKELYEPYKNHLKPINEVRKILAREIPEDERLSREIVELRKTETH